MCAKAILRRRLDARAVPVYCSCHSRIAVAVAFWIAAVSVQAAVATPKTLAHFGI